MTPRPPTMQDMGEFEFIRSIQDHCLFSETGFAKGIGDDCAVMGPYGENLLLLTTDLLVEGIHFILGKIPPQDLGQKAVAVNLSDIAAMGGRPLHLFVSVAFPASMEVETAHSLYGGIKAMCERYKVNILGGDTSASPHGLFVNIAVLGEAPEKEVLYRSGAGAGDDIYVTGTLGDSAAGLRLIKGDCSAPEPLASNLKNRHNKPLPFLEAGRKVAASRLASAMIDLSDGLASDLGHICEASHVGARVFRGNLPLSFELKALAEMNGFDPRDLAVSGGEDYGLLITVPRKNRAAFERLFAAGDPCPVYRVGEIKGEKGLTMRGGEGREEELHLSGFDHFLAPSPSSS